jgi:hypothetical protein
VKVLGGKMCLEVTLISRNECLLVKNECEVHIFEMSSKFYFCKGFTSGKTHGIF